MVLIVENGIYSLITSIPLFLHDLIRFWRLVEFELLVTCIDDNSLTDMIDRRLNVGPEVNNDDGSLS